MRILFALGALAVLFLGAAVVALAGGGGDSPSGEPSAAAPTLAPADEGPTESRLAADATEYTRAVLSGRALELKDLLSITCHGVDPDVVLARRREQISAAVAAAGGDISALTPSAPLVAHFDPSAGIAHALLGLKYQGRQVLLQTADGWLYEGGRWRNSEC